ncbi:MAG: 50S ribosomal protein L9 [Geminicoccaceae bacterium]
MQVILLERVEKLGQMGDVVSVKDGYARNFLIPQAKALRATKRAIDHFEGRRKQLEADNLARREEAEGLRGDVDGRGVVVIRQASENQQLYGSVTARDISDALTEDGVTLDRRQIRIPAPIKPLGLHEVTVALHPEVSVSVTVNVARSLEEADIQAGKAQPVTDEDDGTEDDIGFAPGDLLDDPQAADPEVLSNLDDVDTLVDDDQR